ncbi:NAD(P)/FAD-dependent oxidoreductase [Streptomyces nitrosporeus]|uniref:NAD(P)/FAD-dependent oxidoreductase n=1 Tax=Streptomyces nitrosporeus TaxID=28894 RepID=UPI00399F32C7
MTRIAVIGGGVGGLATALFSARRGHRVTLFEQVDRRVGSDLDRDFFGWNRPAVPQAVQPHVFLSPVRSVLLDEAPDVYAAVLGMGATTQHELDWFVERPPLRPGDEDLVAVRARRIVLEKALADAVQREPGVESRYGDPVVGLVTEARSAIPRVLGVGSASGTHAAELVVDAGGRRSRLPRWLDDAGCRQVREERHRTGIAYFCRWYRLRPGSSPPKRTRTVSAAGFALALVFPSDSDVFGIAVVVSTSDPTRGALRNPGVFDAVARAFPAAAVWLGLDPEPVSGVHTMAGLDNRWWGLADRAGPVVAGVVGVGDCVIHTNPTLSQGVSLALRTAQWTAVHARIKAARDPASLTAEHHYWTVTELKPWFDAQVETDRRKDEGLAAATVPADPRARPGDEAALMACSLDDPVVMRARAQVRHLIAPAEQAYGTDEVRAHLWRWRENHPGFVAPHEGPGRDVWESLTTARDN